MTFKCAPCLDQAITDGHAADSEEAAYVPVAATLVTVMQPFSAGGQTIMAPVTMGVCYSCRQKQLAPVSKTGLVTA